MKALLCTRHGTPDDLLLADIPEPTPRSGEAIVRVKAVALNFFDTLIVAGKGHEEGQIVGSVTLPFSDHEQVRTALAALEGSKI